MENTELWWIDKHKILQKFKYGSSYPSDIQQSGRLFLHQPDPLNGGIDNLFDLSKLPNIDLTTLDISKLPKATSYKTSDPRYVRVYDALRRSGWKVQHTNKSTRVKDDQLREAIDQDLVVSTTEITDFSSLLCFVAGVYHQHVVDPYTNDVYIVDGAQTLRNDRTNYDVTIIDFAPIGGCVLKPITADSFIHKETLPNSALFDISRLQVSLKDYTPWLIVDGYLHQVGTSYTSISSTVIEITISTLTLLFNYLKSSTLRKSKLPIPITAGVNPTSDMHDPELDAFVDNVCVPKQKYYTTDWIMDRLTSVHSAILLLPKTVVTMEQTVQHETDEAWWAAIPTKKSKANSILMVDGKVFSPLYLHTEGYRDRTILSIPYNDRRVMWSLTDPLSDTIASPDKDVRLDDETYHRGKLLQWWNFPLLGAI